MIYFSSDRWRSLVGDRFQRSRRLSISGHFLFWLPLLFTGLALLQLGLVNANLGPASFLPLFVLFICYTAATYFLGGHGDPLLLPLVFFLSGLGLVLTSRLAPAFASRQLAWLVVATALLLFVTLIPANLNWLRRHKYAWLTGGLLLLATTLVLGVNPSGYGARLWLQLGGIYFQPSEPLKLLLVVFLAAYMADRRRQLVEMKLYIGRVPMPHPSYFGPMFMMWGFSMILLLWQRDLGAAFLFFGTFLGMLYAATGHKRYVWAGALLLVVAGTVGYYLFDVVRLRVEAFGNPWLDPAGRSFQIVQSLLAFASGGVFGQGLGQGLPTAIPVVHTDFVFAAIGEEYGMLGALGILVCFAVLIARAFRIALHARSGFEQLLATGIGVVMGLQTVVITAGTLKLMPLTGVTLPFVSYGGSSLVTSFIMLGLLLFVSAGEARPERRVAAPAATTGTLSAIKHLSLARASLTGFLIVAGGLLLWQVVAAPFLVNRDDNPRRIITEQKIRRGRLLTANGVPVAESLVGQDDLVERRYPYPSLSSVTGYYSLRYGVGGTEAIFDPILRGSTGRTTEEAWLDALLHRPVEGRDVYLTINLPAQEAAGRALEEQEGAVVILDINTGAILVMASHPTYDPNRLDETWDSLRNDERAPLLNRATQGLFPLGDLARLVGLIGLAEAGTTIPAEPMVAPLADMLAPLSVLGYEATARQLALTQPLPGLPSQPGRLPDFDDRGTIRDLAATPLHLARVAAALERDGRMPDPVISPMTDTPESQQTQVINPGTARFVRSLLSQVDSQMIGFTGLATPKETGQAWLSWFVGLAPTEASPQVAEPAGGELVLDPSKITSTATPAAQSKSAPARYAIAVVVVTQQPDAEEAALRIARVSLQPLISQ